MMRPVQRLHKALEAVAPIVGCSLKRIQFAESATPEQRAAAEKVFAEFNPDAKTQEELREDRQREIISEFMLKTPASDGERALQALIKLLKKD